MDQGYTAYNHVNFTTSNPVKIVVMLYDGAINFLSQAVEYMELGDIKNKNIYANKARSIIEELNNSLDVAEGKELAEHLRRLYFFMNRHLTKANWNNDVQGFKEVIELLSSLQEAWNDVDAQYRISEQKPQQKAMGIRI